MKSRMESCVTLHMVCSIDGYIAKPDNSLEWLNTTSDFPLGKVLTESDIRAFNEKVDAYVIGANTYRFALQVGWPYGTHPVYVVTHESQKTSDERVVFYNGNLTHLVEEFNKTDANVWIAGGSDLAAQFLTLGLVDKLVISFKPILLGEGLRFFKSIKKEYSLQLEDVTTYRDGMIEITYAIIK